ncbi:uncharacterized protein LOC126898745 [Daktulosphaira vitifoliae]|uniref:uncharacterized protein LOC126898745 n=1 Tax=Daktulosphaira vitifoliae TaxID=58002 RepID=UPI0021A9D90C|nr:uncharacterized protein LOC126898745 [Daktulosphaira vitifoliae]
MTGSKFIMIMSYVIFAILITKLIYSSTLYTMNWIKDVHYYSCYQIIGIPVIDLGLDFEYTDSLIAIFLLLAVKFKSSLPTLNIENTLSTWYFNLAIICLNGIIVPSILSTIYYFSFVLIASLIALKGQRIIVLFPNIFKAIGIYTCIHVVVLFFYQMHWIQAITNTNSDIVKKIGLITFYELQCISPKKVIDLQIHYFLVPFLLYVQYNMLCFDYTEKLNETLSESSKIKGSYINSICVSLDYKQMKKVILFGVRTIGSKVAILIWSINYPGWFTLPLLLWATISWMQKTSRTYFICVMIYAIILLFFEYFSTVVGQNLTELAINFDVQTVDNPLKFSMAMLIKTLLILLIWISLYQIKFSNYEEVRIKSFNWIAPIYDYIACLMTFIVVITMMGFGFIGHQVLTLIRLGYIVLAFVFLFSFQISLTFWRKTITYFWNMTIFYSIVVTTIIHICQFQGFSDFLKHKLYISLKL